MALDGSKYLQFTALISKLFHELALNYFKLQIFIDFCTAFLLIQPELTRQKALQSFHSCHFCFFFSRILLDAGDQDVKEYQNHLSQVLNQEQVNIEHIIISHWHHDHIGGVENLYGSIASKKLGVPSLVIL